MAKVSAGDCKNTSIQVLRALDYAQDLQLLTKAKSGADLEAAFRSSKTDMCEGRSIEEINQRLATSGIPKKFDAQILVLLSYCLYNIGFELTEGVSAKVSLKLDKSFFSGYEIKCKNLHKAVEGILEKYEIDNAIKLLKIVEKGGAYESVISANKDPGALVSKYCTFWIEGMINTFQMMSDPEGVKQRFEIFG